MKKLLKLGALLVLVFVLVVAGLVVWNRDQLVVLLRNAEIEGRAEVPPAAVQTPLPPLTRGQADWICWRGAAGDARSTQTGIFTDWSQGLEKLWEISFLCQGAASATWSAPVVQGNRLVVMGRDPAQDLVFCLDPESGRIIWQAAYPARSPADSAYGSGARATPWIDGDRVYTFGRHGELTCWQLLDGARLWQQNVTAAGGSGPRWGYSSSPLVTESSVIVAGGGSARTVAYDKLTGTMKWRSGSGEAGYAALVMMPIDGHPAILAFHGKGLAALQPEDGRILWDTEWLTSYDVNATTPVWAGDTVFITSGYNTGCQALKVSRSRADVRWRNRAIAAHHSDPFLIAGYLYGYSGQSTQNQGAFKCVDLETGAEQWSTSAVGWGTCVWVDGYLLCLDIHGNLYLLRPSPEQMLLKTSMPRALEEVRGAAWTLPVVANGRLFLRYKQRLVSYRIAPSPAGLE